MSACARNPKLVYGRMTGWGQDGPLAHAAGPRHQLHRADRRAAPIGRQGEPPVPPLNLVGDFGGGGMLPGVRLVCALLEARRSGEGQVVDAAMVDGAAPLMTIVLRLRAVGHVDRRARARTCSTRGAHFYDVYETADGKYVSSARIEPQFYDELLETPGLDPGEALPATA